MALPHGGRKFYEVERRETIYPLGSEVQDKETLLQYVGDNVIGGNAKFSGPFGTRQGESYWYITS